MPAVERIRVYPVKGLDGIEVDAAEVVEGGTLARDREFALFDDEGVINGKRTDRVHDLRTDFDPDNGAFRVETPAGATERFALDDPGERERAQAWFGDFFGEDLTLERDDTLGYVDRREMGPSVISTGTLEAVASWFEGLTVESVRRRLRANVEVSGVEPFWEDRFVGAEAPAFAIDGVRFEGVTPCGRCVVPRRHPDTGEPTPEFREQFVQKRKETFPPWADEEAFDHHYTVMIITSVATDDREQSIAVGDPVETVLGSKSRS